MSVCLGLVLVSLPGSCALFGCCVTRGSFSWSTNPFTNFELHLGRIEDVSKHIGLTITGYTLVGGEGAVRELMEILRFTAQLIVKLSRIDTGSRGGTPRTSPAREIAEAVMGRIAWDIYKNIEYKHMTGSRRPRGSAALKKHVTARNKKLGASMSGWSLECEPEHFHRR